MLISSRSDGGPERRAILHLAMANVALAVLHAATYWRLAGPDLGGWGRAYLALGLAAQLWAGAVLSIAPALAATRAPSLRRAVAPLAVAGSFLFQAFLELDRTVLAVLGSHLHRELVRVALAPGGLASLDVDRREIAWTALQASALLAAEAGAFAWLRRRAERRGGPSRPALVRAAFAIVLLLSAERVAYAVGVGTRAPDVARAAGALPAFELERAARLRVDALQRLRYPRVEPTWAAVERPPNLLLVVVESWRADALRPDLMPATWALSGGALRFERHRSGGNWTGAGVFSLLYGIHASYYDRAVEARRGALLFDRARALGYQIQIVASRTTRFPRFSSSAFAALRPGEVDDDIPGADSAERDRGLVARARAFLARRDPARPFLLALFLDATHLPYAFAPEHAVYRPYTEHLYYREMVEPQEPGPIRNRYLNAVRDVDASIGAIADALARSGADASTAVVLTGDHGQEFYEHGALGHNISFDLEQTAVPLVLRLPGVAPGVRTDPSRGVDVAPTLLALLGARGDPAGWSNGRSLLDGPGDGRAVVCGMRDCALVLADGTTAVFRPDEPSLPVHVHDAEYRPLPGARVPSELVDVRRELTWFLE